MILEQTLDRWITRNNSFFNIHILVSGEIEQLHCAPRTIIYSNNTDPARVRSSMLRTHQNQLKWLVQSVFSGCNFVKSKSSLLKQNVLSLVERKLRFFKINLKQSLFNWKMPDLSDAKLTKNSLLLFYWILYYCTVSSNMNIILSIILAILYDLSTKAETAGDKI